MSGDATDDRDESASGPELEPDPDWIEIGNEFASVLLRRVMTRNGARLEIRSPKRELSVLLDATILEGLTWQTSESFSLFLETPLEPLSRRRSG